MTTGLTSRQEEYLWLMGSFPDLVMVQGRGRRTPRLLYAVCPEEGELVIFGYSNPPMWLASRGFIRKLQGHNMYTLTETGEAEFKRLLGRGGVSSTRFKETRVKRP